MAKDTKYPESHPPSPQAIDVQEDAELRPMAVKLKGTSLTVASIDARGRKRSRQPTPMTILYYTVTLEDGRQLTIFKNMTYERWYRAA